MANYTKTDLTAEIAAQFSLPKSEAGKIIDTVLTAIREQAEDGKTVVLTGFGRFAMKERAARQGRNPATGETIQIAASRSLGFKPSKSST